MSVIFWNLAGLVFVLIMGWRSGRDEAKAEIKTWIVSRVLRRKDAK